MRTGCPRRIESIAVDRGRGRWRGNAYVRRRSRAGRFALFVVAGDVCTYRPGAQIRGSAFARKRARLLADGSQRNGGGLDHRGRYHSRAATPIRITRHHKRAGGRTPAGSGRDTVRDAARNRRAPKRRPARGREPSAVSVRRLRMDGRSRERAEHDRHPPSYDFQCAIRHDRCTRLPSPECCRAPARNTRLLYRAVVR